MSATFELGVALPNGGPSPTVERVLRVAEAADELGFDSVWTSEHVIVAADAPPDYRQSIEGMTCLAWIAARHERLALGTSVVILPLHDPIGLAKRAATLQLVSGGRFRLGVGVGWHEPEFAFLGADFRRRGDRADEALRTMRALWHGEGPGGASFGPLPEVPPQVWVGGNSPASRRRASELGDVWHPLAPSPEDVREFAGRVAPRLQVPESMDEARDALAALRDAGAEGAVLSFGGDVDRMSAFAREAAPALRG